MKKIKETWEKRQISTNPSPMSFPSNLVVPSVKIKQRQNSCSDAYEHHIHPEKSMSLWGCHGHVPTFAAVWALKDHVNTCHYAGLEPPTFLWWWLWVVSHPPKPSWGPRKRISRKLNTSFYFSPRSQVTIFFLFFLFLKFCKSNFIKEIDPTTQRPKTQKQTKAQNQRETKNLSNPSSYFRIIFGIQI